MKILFIASMITLAVAFSGYLAKLLTRSALDGMGMGFLDKEDKE